MLIRYDYTIYLSVSEKGVEQVSPLWRYIEFLFHFANT
jgi:hypothetical protein